MKTNDIVRAWRDEDYFNSLSEAERAALPANPAGEIQLSDEELANVNGAWTPTPICGIPTAAPCTPFYLTYAFRCFTNPLSCRG